MNLDDTLHYINDKINNFKPELALILGSGLGDFADNFEGIRLKYSDIPEFGTSEVVGHKNQLIFTEIENKKTVIMQGRYHYYEGHSIDKVVYPIKVFKRLGVKKLIITNAAGLINDKFSTGSFMLIKDHINMMGVDPLRGMNNSDLGERFPDMSEIYKKYLIEIARKSAKMLGIDYCEGIYCARSGPSYETPAEIRMLKTIGADAVGMSTVPEAVCANYCKIDVLGISCLTNYASGISENKLSHAEVMSVAQKAKQNFQNLVIQTIKQLG